MNLRRRDCFGLLISVPVIAKGAEAEMPSMFRPAICAYSFRNELKTGKLSYADVIRMAAETGCCGIDLTSYWLPDTNDETLFALKRLAYKLSVSIYSIGIRARMVQPSPELRSAVVANVRQWIDVSLRLGAGHIRVFGGDVPAGATQEQAIGWAAETLKFCADEAGKKGILLGLEDDGGITTTAEVTVEIVRRAGSQWAGITLDVGNFEDDAYRQIEICAPYATNVHFKSHVQQDGRHETADWQKILGILRKAGYRGYLALEYEEDGSPAEAVPRLIARMRKLIGNG